MLVKDVVARSLAPGRYRCCASALLSLVPRDIGSSVTRMAGQWRRLKWRAGSCEREFLNNFVNKNNIDSVIEFGCGDGHQLSLADYPRYIGLDVSRTAIELCSHRFLNDPTKSFFLYDGSVFCRSCGPLQITAGDLTGCNLSPSRG